MIVNLQSSAIKGKLKAPPSKSMTQRAFALALLHEGKTTIENAGASEDELAARHIIEQFGAKLIDAGNGLLSVVASFGSDIPASIDCGESGLSFRMFTPIAALSNHPINVIGRGSLLNRPMDFLQAHFPQLGVKVQSNAGKPPLVVQGPMIPRDITMDGSQSSQFLTGMLIAFAKATRSPVVITVQDLASKPYIDLTLSMMNAFEYAVRHEQYEVFTIDPSQGNHSPVHCKIEGDWSGAAFFLVAAAITGSLEITGLDPTSKQGDIAILEVLKAAGATVCVSKEAIHIERSSLNGFSFDASNCPDLFPPLVALAAYCEGPSVIEGVARLAHKESNRGITLQKEFSKMGVEIVLEGDRMIIKGNGKPAAADFDSHHDHRIAMAAAVAALGTPGASSIKNADAINKSYPGFFKDLQAVGANCTIIQ